MFLNDMSTIVRYSNVYMNRSLLNRDITSTENFILMYLFTKDKVTQEEISDYYAIDKGNISKMVRKLEKKGYIEKSVNSKNRRENMITLTEEGRNSFSESKHLLDEWHIAIMDNITKAEFHQMVRILSTMAKNARKIIGTDK